ncbi:MAG: metallophosphoesterase [Acidimicrobiia bacterium]
MTVLTSRAPRGPHVEVFAVSDERAQLVWRSLSPGRHELSIGSGSTAFEVSMLLDARRSIGAITFDGLMPGSRYVVRLDGLVVGEVRTLVPPPGPARHRIATISDLHIGERNFGHLPRIRDGEGELHSITCVRAALAEITAWGADVLLIKGDLTHHNRRSQYQQLAELLAAVPIPVAAIPGNHDGGNHRSDGAGAGAMSMLRDHGVLVVDDADVIELPGVTVVAANTMRHGRSTGSLDHLPAIVRAVDRPEPVLLAIHHQLMPWLTYWPPGMVGLNAHRLLREVHAVNPRMLITGGHTHRHRRWQWRSVMITEVGSPKDHPGTWAGYVVHDGGIQQSVYRVADPLAMAWTERTADTVLGMWGRWSPGELDDRCFSHTWPAPLSRGSGADPAKQTPT